MTTDRRTIATVLSPEAYDRPAEQAELADNPAVIDRGVEDVAARRVREARADIEAIVRARGLTLPVR